MAGKGLLETLTSESGTTLNAQHKRDFIVAYASAHHTEVAKLHDGAEAVEFDTKVPSHVLISTTQESRPTRGSGGKRYDASSDNGKWCPTAIARTLARRTLAGHATIDCHHAVNICLEL